MSFKHNNAGSTNCLLVQLVPPIDNSICKKVFAAVPCTSKFFKCQYFCVNPGIFHVSLVSVCVTALSVTVVSLALK